MDTRVETKSLEAGGKFFKTKCHPAKELPVCSSIIESRFLEPAQSYLVTPNLGIIALECERNKRKFYVVDKRFWVLCRYGKSLAKNYHEVFIESRPTKFVLDLEIKGLENKTQEEREDKVLLFNRFKEYLLASIIEVIKGAFKEEIKRSDFLELTATDIQIKLSEHVILEGGIYFKDMVSVRHFMYIVLQRIFYMGTPEMKQAAHDFVWDTEIYRLNRQLRLPYSANYGDRNPKRVLKPLHGDIKFDMSVVERAMVQYGEPRIILEIDAPVGHFEKTTLQIEKIQFGTSRKEFGTKFGTKGVALSDDDKLTVEQMINSFQDANIIDTRTGQPRTNIKDIERRAPYVLLDVNITEKKRIGTNVPSSEPSYLLIVRTEPSYCPIKDGFHHSAGTTFYYSESTFTINCFSALCKKKSKITMPLVERDGAIVRDIIERYK